APAAPLSTIASPKMIALTHQLPVIRIPVNSVRLYKSDPLTELEAISHNVDLLPGKTKQVLGQRGSTNHQLLLQTKQPRLENSELRNTTRMDTNQHC
ncbi:hypothetical protein SeLEV6574_g08640, partial [Synchytrium endobioticum]